MSAFVVGDEIINDVVNYLATARRYGAYEYHAIMAREYMIDMSNTNEAADLARAMFDLNVKAVDARYGAGEAAGFRSLNFSYARTANVITPMQAYKSLACWLYQCAEGDIPASSPLYAAMEKAHDAMAHHMVRSLPAYESAKGW